MILGSKVSDGTPRVDDQLVLIGNILNNYNGLRLHDAPKECGPRKPLCNRRKLWSDKGIFARMMAGLAAEIGKTKTVRIDATYLKARRPATGTAVKKGGVDA